MPAPGASGHRGTAYRSAGVDLEAGARAVEMIASVASVATRPEVVEGVGGFAGLFRLPGGGLLAAATDGVGTKLEVARLAGRLDTVGIDLVAMCANDVVCTGAEPLFFLDYLAVGKVVPSEVAEIVTGVAEGCRRAGCALLGGETAEHPGVMDVGQFDLAGFCVGLVDEGNLLGPDRVREGDLLVGIPSSGLHSNGYSLVRKAFLDGPEAMSLEDAPAGFVRSLADELLEPTAIYVPTVLDLARAGLVHAAAHVTGGGFHENLPRMLPPGLGAIVDRASWAPPPIFDLVAERASASPDEMFSTFNMGIGMVLTVPASAAGHPLLEAAGPVIGRVVGGRGVTWA